MRYRFTIKMLKELSDEELLRMLVYERMTEVTNVNAPLYQRLKKLYESIK